MHNIVEQRYKTITTLIESKMTPGDKALKQFLVNKSNQCNQADNEACIANDIKRQLRILNSYSRMITQIMTLMNKYSVSNQEIQEYEDKQVNQR